MKPFVAIGITTGVLAGVWTWASGEIGLYTWAGFVAWALFFAAGGKFQGLTKVVPAAVTGVLYGWLVFWLAEVIPSTLTVPIGVIIITFLMCVQANWKVLVFIPGAFGGAAVFFGTGGDPLGSLIAILSGALLGWLGEFLAGFLDRPRNQETLVAREHEPTT